MARIRTVKPEFFRHEGLQDLELANPGKCLMLVFSGLWVISDREGRFEWRPRRIKLDVLPFLPFDMEETLDLLAEAGFITKYEADGELYGAVNSWERHQIVGRDEPPSEIPAPDGSITPYFRPLNQTQRFKVYERDKWTCAYCERDMSNDRRAACLDHVIPYSRGGTNREKNLVTACKRCNAEKNNKTPSEAGLKWPDGLGEYYDRTTNDVVECHVNPPLTGGLVVPDKEVEREEGKGRGNGNGKEVPPAGATPPKFAPEDISLAETILEGVKTVAPSSRPRMDKWAETIRLMRERDGRTHGDIMGMFRWANTHSFWRTNILSPEKLREKWTTLEAQQRSPPRGEMKTRQQMADERSRAAVDEFVGSGRIIEGEKA